MGTDQDNTLVSSFSHDSDVAHPSTGVMKPRSLWQNLRRYPKVSAYCIALTSGILLWGYDLAMSGNLAGMDQFKYVQLLLQVPFPTNPNPGKTTANSTKTNGSSPPSGWASGTQAAQSA